MTKLTDSDYEVLKELCKMLGIRLSTKTVADESLRVYSMEITFVDRTGHVCTQSELKKLRHRAEKALRNAFPDADDVYCAWCQQAITKSHEELC